MRVPMPWLRDFVRTDAALEEVCAALTSRGFTVDAVLRQPMPERIVIGLIDKLERHPNADRLRVASVDVGSEKLQVVTGADNVRVGQKVPIALVGAEVYERAASGTAQPSDGAPKTKKILKSALRGVESAGMMCSADELALPGDFEDGIIIMEDEAAPGAEFWKVARYGEAVLEVDVPSNRPDCLSIVGLAREAAAALGGEFLEPHLKDGIGDKPSPVGVEIGDPDVCRRLVGQHFWGLQPRRTPLWMKLRLHGAGVRDLNFWVDVSNYVQIETGQPLHFYDAKKLRGGAIVARGAREGETVTTLDGVVRALPAGTPVIADASGPVGVAGIFGGAAAAVTDETRELFLESPNFVGPRIRRAGIALGLRTEGALRHEKNLPLELPEFGRRHAAHLLAGAGAVPSQIVEAGQKPAAPRETSVRPQRANLVLGTDYSADDVRGALAALGFATSGEDPVRVRVPYWRGDVVDEIDVIEEVARSKGYESIAQRRANAAPQDIDDRLYRQEERVAQAAAAAGYKEIVTFALAGTRMLSAWERSGIPFWSEIATVANPLSDDQRFLRPSLLPGMLAVAARDWPRAGGSLRLFEIGHIFRASVDDEDRAAPGSGAYSENGVVEWPSLCGVAAFADTDDDAPLDFRLLEIRGDAEAIAASLAGSARFDAAPKAHGYLHPGASAHLSVGDAVIGKFGRLHPRIARAYELPSSSYAFFLYLERLPARPPVRGHVPPPKFPGTTRDLAVLVDEAVSAGDLMRAIRTAGGPMIEDARAFDEYRGAQVGAGKKSVAIRVALRKADRTITDSEADEAIDAIVRELKAAFKAELRGAAS